MESKLSLNWNLGMAFGELSSSLFLTFLVLVFMKQKLSKNNFSILFAISGFTSMIIGWVVGSWISGQGYGLSIMSPISAIFFSFYFKTFGALWFILLFQLIGTILGLCLFYLYKSFAIEKNKETKIILEKNISIQSNISKSIIFQLMMVLSICLIPLLDQTAYQTGKLLNGLILAIIIGVVIFASHDLNFTIFSPFLSLVVLVNGIIEKKYTLKHLINLSIEIAIQQSWLWIMILINHFVYLEKGGWY